MAWNGIGLVLVRAAQVRGRAQRVRARDSGAAGLRRSALQHELHALEPRRFRGRAARDEARARARPVLRRAEVRAGDGRRVRGSRHLDPARPRRRAARPTRRSPISASIRSRSTRCSPGSRRRDAGARSAPAVRSTDSSPFAMATDFLSKGLYDRASAEISRAMARGSARAEGLALLGDVFAQQGLYGEALERYREALRLEPDIAARDDRRSVVRSCGSGARREARPIAERLLADDRDDVEVLMLDRDGVRRIGRSRGGARRCSKRRDASRRCAPTFSRRSATSRARSATTRARSRRTGTRCELDQDFAVVRFQLARLLQAKGQNREAEQELVAALDAVPTYAEATLELATLRRRLGRAERSARRCSIELLQRDPYHFDALIALGETLLALGRKRDAVHAFARVLRFDPSHVGALFHEGVLLAEQRRYRDAIERWERVIDLERDDRVRAARAPRDSHGDGSAARSLGAARARGVAHGDRRTASRARHSRRLPAARPEPEDGRAARLVGAARGRRASSCSTAAASCRRRFAATPMPTELALLQAGRVTEADLERARARQANGRARRATSSTCSSRSARSRRRSSSGSCACTIESVVFELMSWREGFFSFEERARAEMPVDTRITRVDRVAAHGGRAPHRRVVAHRGHRSEPRA